MGDKRVLAPFHTLVDESMGASFTSEPTNALNQDNIGIQISWTSADAVGSIAIEASIDWDHRLETGNFYPLTFDPVLDQPSSNNGGYLVNLNQLPYTWYRISYTRSSGTGVFNAWITSKAV